MMALLIVVFGSSLPSSTKNTPKNVVRVGPPLTKLSGFADVSRFAYLVLCLECFYMTQFITKPSQCRAVIPQAPFCLQHFKLQFHILSTIVI